MGVSQAAVKTSLAGVCTALLDYWKLAAVGSSRSLPELAACDCSIRDGRGRQIFEEWRNQDLVRD